MNRTYSRKTNSTASILGGRKPLGSYNSAPSLSGASVVKPKGFYQEADSLDDFVVENKPTKPKAAKNKETDKRRNQAKKKENLASSFFSSSSKDSSSSSKSDFSSPVFNVAKVETKDDVFDKLFTEPVKTTYVPKNRPSWDSSKDYFSAESSVERGNSSNGGLLFASFGNHAPENDGNEALPAAEKKSSRGLEPKPQKTTSNKTRKASTTMKTRQKLPTASDRLFSEDTLNYIAEDLDEFRIDGNDSVDVFSSPMPQPQDDKGAALETPVALTFTKSPLCNLSPILVQKPPPTSSTVDKFSPLLCQKATSTPTLAGPAKPKGLSQQEAQNFKLPSLCYNVESRYVSEMIARKGGKNWRRSVKCTTPDRRGTVGEFGASAKRSSGFVLSRKAMIANARRQTFHPSSLAFGEEEEQEHDTSCKSTVVLSKSVHSSSYIETCDGNESTVESPIWTKVVVTGIEKVLAICTNKEVIPFESMYGVDRLSKSTKIGEGAFGEVFLLPDEETDKDPPVVKIVPVDGTALVNNQVQTKLSDILAEIIISTELSKLATTTNGGDGLDSTFTVAPGFLSVLRCDLAQGNYPEILLEKWDVYDREKTSENDRPDGNLFKDQDEMQKFVVLELSNGGQDLEHITLNNAAQGLAIFNQVAHAMAMAEKAYSFEHRDLHWGNVLVRESGEKTISFKHKDEHFEVETLGMQATIIDFSLSRMTKDKCDIFNNLSEDEELFKSEGDYQFDIYRLMRQHTRDDWRGFHPKTNVFWLHYLLDKLTGEVFYRNKKSKTHRSALGKMLAMKDSFIESYDSCYDYVKQINSSN